LFDFNKVVTKQKSQTVSQRYPISDKDSGFW